MPQVTVYIRSGDLDKWKTLEKKSEFIHNALNSLRDMTKYPPNVNQDLKPIKISIESPTISEKLKEKRTLYQQAADNKVMLGSLGLCKHGADPKFCKFAKPGKICK